MYRPCTRDCWQTSEWHWCKYYSVWRLLLSICPESLDHLWVPWSALQGGLLLVAFRRLGLNFIVWWDHEDLLHWIVYLHNIQSKSIRIWSLGNSSRFQPKAWCLHWSWMGMTPRGPSTRAPWSWTISMSMYLWVHDIFSLTAPCFLFFFFQPFSNEQAGSFTSPVQPMYAAP